MQKFQDRTAAECSVLVSGHSRRQSRRSLSAASALAAVIVTGGAQAQVPAQMVSSGIPQNTHDQAPNMQNGNTAGNSEKITVKAQRRLVREKNSPSAVTELGAAQIAQVGIQGSVATLLRAAPSVYVYQQGIGENEPVLTVRGARGLETAQTLDGVPMQDLLSGGGGNYLQNLLGGHFNLDQISGVSIYPGVAYPDKSTFGTIGGTIAYTSLRPSNDTHADLFGSVGSFGTWDEGFDLNSGRMDGILGTGADAPTMMLKYSNLQTNGFIEYTPARYNSMEYAFDKPYDQGLSLFQATVNYNTGSGLTLPEPVPLPFLQKYGMYSNYSPTDVFQRQSDDYLTLILKNDTYINDFVSAGLTLFYLNSDSNTTSYGNPTIFGPNGEPGSVTVGSSSPFSQTPAGYAEQGLYGRGNVFYDPQAYPYTASSAGCPAALQAEYAAADQPSPCGYNAQQNSTHDDTYGFQPRLTITPSAMFGILNTIKLGGIVAKETQPASHAYASVYPNVPELPQNEIWSTVIGSTGGYDGGFQRTIYQGYLQDKIDFVHNTLHVTPGLTIEGTDSSDLGSEIFGGTPSASLLASAYCQAENPCDFGSYKAHKWDREYLPFINVSYDLDRILPVARGVSFYGSAGTSALFAPVTDFGPNLIGSPPNASIVHLYEGGVKYNKDNLVLSMDYFYQHVERDFGYYSYEFGPLAGEAFYSNNGQREFKGFEASAIWQVTPNWQLFGNVSHTLAKYLATTFGYASVQEDQFGVVVRGTPVTGVPDWLSTFGVDYDRRNVGIRNDELNIRFEGQYTGKQATTYDLNGLQNVGPIAGVGAPGTYNYYSATAGATTYDPNGGISPFATFNLDLNYKLPVYSAGPIKQLSFDLNVINMFNTHYFQYLYRQVAPATQGNFTSGPFKGEPISPYSGPSFANGIAGEPAAVTFTVSARF